MAWMKVYRGGGGSHRRSRPSERLSFDGRRDEYVHDTRPLAGEAVRGESTVAQCPLAAGREGIVNTNVWQAKGVVRWLSHFGSTALEGTYTRKTLMECACSAGPPERFPQGSL